MKTSLSPLPHTSPALSRASTTLEIGIIPGEGIGPELTDICLRLLERIARRRQWTLKIEHCGPVGLAARECLGKDFPADSVRFVQNVFSRGGAILAGAGGGRFVYDMRRQFRLDWKLNPIRQFRGLARRNHPFDILVVRDNREGLYQGNAQVEETPAGRIVHHTLVTSTEAARTVTDKAAALAATRQGRLTIVAKESGLPEVSRIWREAGEASATAHGVEWHMLEIDFAAYQLVQSPQTFDVVAVPNAFGDILADLGGIVMGSRGTTYGASFTTDGFGVFQTNHGAAYDLADRDTANPAGQIFSLAMMLRESFGQTEAATRLEDAVQDVWASGLHTPDLDLPGGRPCGTSAFAAAVDDRLRELLE
jgi:3-isopropylmalate dehydrogenase